MLAEILIAWSQFFKNLNFYVFLLNKILFTIKMNDEIFKNYKRYVMLCLILYLPSVIMYIISFYFKSEPVSYQEQ
jgi:hypothetical protein